MPIDFFQFILYAVFIFSIIAYAALDGFDLGVGSLHLFARGDQERRLMINAIGPVWDGNTTWIVIGGGVLFAAFPKVFATLSANLYTPVMLLLFAFMLRAASIEFRGKRSERWWRRTWDFCFFFASLILALNVGFILGNWIEGMPIDEKGLLVGGIKTLIRPYPFLISLFGLSLFMMHGSIYLMMKTEGKLHNRMRKWAKRLIFIFLFFWAVATLVTIIRHPRMVAPFWEHPALNIFILLSFGGIGALCYCIAKRKDGLAFVCSCLSIVFFLLLFVVGTFPYFVFSTIDPVQNSLTLFNSSVTKKALIVLTIVAASGIPLSFFYGSYVYRIFRGKIQLDHHSY